MIMAPTQMSYPHEFISQLVSEVTGIIFLIAWTYRRQHRQVHPSHADSVWADTGVGLPLQCVCLTLIAHHTGPPSCRLRLPQLAPSPLPFQLLRMVRGLRTCKCVYLWLRSRIVSVTVLRGAARILSTPSPLLRLGP